jgi:hypothetical protein
MADRSRIGGYKNTIVFSGFPRWNRFFNKNKVQIPDSCEGSVGYSALGYWTVLDWLDFVVKRKVLNLILNAAPPTFGLDRGWLNLYN